MYLTLNQPKSNYYTILISKCHDHWTIKIRTTYFYKVLPIHNFEIVEQCELWNGKAASFSFHH